MRRDLFRDQVFLVRLARLQMVATVSPLSEAGSLLSLYYASPRTGNGVAACCAVGPRWRLASRAGFGPLRIWSESWMNGWLLRNENPMANRRLSEANWDKRTSCSISFEGV